MLGFTSNILFLTSPNSKWYGSGSLKRLWLQIQLPHLKTQHTTKPHAPSHFLNKRDALFHKNFVAALRLRLSCWKIRDEISFMAFD